MIPDDANRDGIAITGASDTLPDYMKSAPAIETLRTRFDEARDLTAESRERSLRDRDYYDGPKQLDSDVRRILELRKQPPIYTNRIRPAINGVLGVLESGRSDPKGLPRNPDDEQAAPVATKTLRFIADTCDFADLAMEVAENFFIEGDGAAIIELDGDKIVATQIRWEEFYADPYSRRNDYKDARFMGVAKWKDAAEIREKYKARINEIGDPMGGTGFWIAGGTWEDRPEGRGWVDRKRRRVLLVEEYAIVEGVWHRIVYVATGVLEYCPSPYLDEKKRPCNPIEAVSCYVAGGTNGQSQGMAPNTRYGVIRDMIPIQDEVNASRSRALHLMNSRQVQRTDPTAPLVADTTVQAAASAADGVLPPGYQIVQVASDAMMGANLARMQEAKGEIERMSPTPLARDLERGSAVSGRARQVAQAAGLSEIARPMARLKDWRLRCYRQMWERARQFKTGPWWVRVTDDVRAPEFLKINEPVMGMVMQQMQNPETGEVIQVPSVGVVGHKNRIAEMDLDIILDEDADTAALQEEVFAELMELVRMGISPFSPEFELLIEMSPLSGKAAILERLEAKRKDAQEAQQGQEQPQQRAQELLEAKTIAEVEKTQAQKTQIEVDTMVTAFEAGFETAPKEPPLEQQPTGL